MKSTGVNCGNVNMKGKKSKILSCMCCVCQDFREKELEKAHRAEMSNESKVDISNTKPEGE